MPKTNPLKDALHATEGARPTPPPLQAAQPPPTPPRAVAGSTKLVGARFPEEVHRQVRVLAASEGRTVHAIIAEALNDLFSKRGLPPIA